MRTINLNLKEKHKLQFLSSSSIYDFMDQRNEMVEKLERSLAKGASKQELLAIIESLKNRTGTYGVQRKELLNYLFKGIIDLSFPTVVKNLFFGSTHNMGLFEETGEVSY